MYTYIHVYISTYIYINTLAHLCTNIFLINLFICLSIHMYMCIYICIYISAYTCMHICIRILCIFKQLYIYIKKRILILCLIYVYLLQGSGLKLVGPFWHILVKRDPPACASRFEKVFEKSHSRWYRV